MDIFTAETDELLPVTVTNNGVPILSGVSFSITGPEARPTTWTAATILEGQTHVRVASQPEGVRRVWAKIETGTETAVVICGDFLVV